MLRHAQHSLHVRASRPGLHEITDEIESWVRSSRFQDGLLTIFCRHTSASLLIQENAARAAARDLESYFARIAPEAAEYEHDDEGPDDMPAHLRAALTATQLSIPIRHGELILGRWQGIFLFEHRRSPSDREVALHMIGE